MNLDTINLLKECNAGCKSATNSMEQVLPFVKEEQLKKIITESNHKHVNIGDKCHTLLNENGVDEKDPNMMAKVFSWVTTEMKLMMDDKSSKIAGIMLDGCHMGIKSLAEYINQYEQADAKAIHLAKELIHVEQEFMNELLNYV
ncbi:hypothetical protein P261_02331 [Lachnospiraceae bacterium TWA4]|nr:hypothetical protein P261_02331 [Lachnospiraceae bacterium TWA4]